MEEHIDDLKKEMQQWKKIDFMKDELF